MADFDDNYDDDYVDSNDTIEESEDIQDASEDYPEDSEPETEDFSEDVNDDAEEEPEDSEPETEDFPEDEDDDVEDEPEDSEPETEDFPEDEDNDVEDEPKDSEPETEDFPEDEDNDVEDEPKDSEPETDDYTENENDEVEEVTDDKKESDNTTEDIEGEANDLQSIVEQSEREMHEAWAEAEAWADANGMTEWSDGTPRMNANIENPSYVDSEESNDMEPDVKTLEYVDNGEPSAIDVYQNENKSEEDYYDDPETALAHIDEQVEAFEKECLTQEVEQNNENLNKDYINLLNKKDAAFSATIDASTPEEARRYADIQYELGEQMEEIKRKIIENNNRLK